MTSRYTERLLPPWWVWVVAALLTNSLSIAYGDAFGASAGWAVYAVVGAIVAVALVVTSPRIEVADGHLRAGRARIAVELLGRVVVLDASRTRAARTTDGSPTAYVVMRAWCSPRSVLAEVDDSSDPHPYWLITSRRPERLADAIESARPTA